MAVLTAVLAFLCGTLFQGTNGQTYTVTILRNPIGTPVSASMYDYPILSSVTLTCMVTSSDGSTPTMINYQWNTTGCYTNNLLTTPTCFPTGQTTQRVTGNNLLAEDAGTITCSATIGDVGPHTSESLTLRISGVAVTTVAEGMGGPTVDLINSNKMDDYTFVHQPFTLDSNDAVLRCATGLGPSGADFNPALGGWYFNGSKILYGSNCDDNVVIEARGAPVRRFPGVINLYVCGGTLSTTEEGVYSCTVMNSARVLQTRRIGLYLMGRTGPMIDDPSPVTVTAGTSITLSCTSRGSPPDTFTWRKDGGPIEQSTSITAVTYDNGNAVFHGNFTTTITTSGTHTYTCTVTNPIGNDSATITVTATAGPPEDVKATVMSPQSVVVTWTQSPSADSTGYRIIHNTTAPYISVNNRSGNMTVNGPSTTSHTFTGLEENTPYTITVQTRTNIGFSVNSDPVSVTTWTDEPSSPPQNVMVTSVNPSSLMVSWQPPPEIDHNGVITGYVLQYQKDGSNNMMSVNLPSRTTRTISGLDPFVQYSVTVAAINVNGTGPFSNPEVQTSGQDRPTVPRSLMVDSVTDTTVTLSWMTPDPPNGIITQYELQYRRCAGGSSTLQSLNNINTRRVTGLAANTEYCFSMRAYTIESLGPSPYTDEVMRRTYGPPTDVNAVTMSPNSIEVTWDPPVANRDDVDGYIISYNAVEGFADDDSMSVGRSSTMATIDELEEFVSYDITVLAVYNTISVPTTSSVGVRTWSDVPDGPPRDIRLMTTDPAMLSVTYTPPEPIFRNGDVTGYEIRYTRVGSDISEMRTIGGGSANGDRTSAIPGLVAFTSYSVQVAAVNVNGTGPPSDPVVGFSGEDRPATAPHSLTATPQSRFVTLSWMAPDTPNGIIIQYEVQYSVNSTSLGNFTDTMMNAVERLSPSTIYTLHIRAYTRVGAGPFSNSITVMTLPEPPPPVATDVPPESITSSMLTINWMEPNVPTGVIDHYTVFYLPVSGPYGPIMTSNRRKRQLAQDGEFAMDFPGTSGTLTNLNGSVTYRIQVSAVALYSGDELIGSRSTSQFVTTNEGTPTEPRDIVATNVTQSSISLTWQRPDPPNGLITNFTVSIMVTNYNQDTGQMDPFTANGLIIVDLNDDNISATLNVTDLRLGTEYQFIIAAYTNVGPGPEVMISVFTLPDVPPMPITPEIQRTTDATIIIEIPRSSDENGPIMYYAVVVVMIGEDETNTTNMEDIGPFNNEEADTAISGGQPYTYITGIVETSDISIYPYPYIVGDGSKSSIGGVNYVNVRLQPKTIYIVMVRAHTAIDLFSTSAPVTATTSSDDGGGGGGGGGSGAAIGAGVAVAVVVVVVIIIIIAVVWYMKRRNGESTFSGKKDLEESSVVALKDMTDHGKSAGSFEPEIIGLPSDLMATEGQSFTFPSHATGKPAPDVYWYLNSKDMTENDDVEISSNGQLTLTVVRTDHEGEWRCQATSSSGSSEARTYLTVKSTKPKPLPSPRPGRRHKPIPTGEFGVHVNMLHENSNQGFKDEYESFYNGQDMSTAVGSAPSNKFKNRFANIVAYDNNRVALAPCGQYKDDYINASPVDGYKHPKYFIAAQAPVNKTLADFWRLIWQEHPPTIVMVTNLKEGEKVKCVQYWPNAVGETLTFGPLRIHMSEEFEFADYIVRTIELKNSEQRNRLHVVTQYHFTSWPDHGVPEYATAMLAFHRRVRADHHSSIGPMMVHCSAGVGRTGTFITIDIALEQVKAEGVVDIYNIVTKLRHQRPHMVQALEQYMFIHDGILESITCGNTQVSAPDLQRMVTKLRQRDPHTNLTGYEQQFKVLKQVSPRVEEQVSNSAMRNPDKNRPNHCYPMEKGRVILRKEKPDYINAAFLKGYKQDKAFIVAQSPMQNTVRDFWKMMVDRQCACVVMLCELEEGGQEVCAPYWPETGSFTYGDMVVANINVVETKEFTTRVFKVTDKKANVTHQVTQFHMHSWGAYKSPASNAGILAMIEEVQKVQRGTGNKPIVVHCSNVLGRTGTFCILFTILDRFKVEQVVDVVQTVKLLRIKRPGIVEDLDQYQFIYSTVLRYLQSFDTYDNFKI